MVTGAVRRSFCCNIALLGPCTFPLCKVGHGTVTVKVIAITLWTLF